MRVIAAMDAKSAGDAAPAPERVSSGGLLKWNQSFIMPWVKREIWIASMAVALLGVLLYRIAPHFEIHRVEVGDDAPEFELAGGVRLADYRGKLVLLNFWATWCPPCVAEVPSLNALYKQFREDGLVVLAVSVDTEEEAYRRFLDRFGVTFPTVLDPERRVSSRYGTMKYPESYLIDRQGTVIQKYVGPEDWERPEIVNYIRSLL